MPLSRDWIKSRLTDLHAMLDAELDEARAKFRYRIDRGRVIFDRDVRTRHRAAREGLRSFLSRTRPLVVLTVPFIYGLIVPFVLLDLMVVVYQAVCFPVYGIAKVRRADYVYIDRHQLGYLNGLQKLNCVYCGYGNGLIAFVREVAARTEAYWCPIKHSRRVADPHALYPGFAGFGDDAAFQARVTAQRAALRENPENAD